MIVEELCLHFYSSFRLWAAWGTAKLLGEYYEADSDVAPALGNSGMSHQGQRILKELDACLSSGKESMYHYLENDLCQYLPMF